MVSENNYSFPHLIVDQEATLGVGAEDGTAEAAQEAGAAPTGATGVPGELADPALCLLCSPGPARAKWALRLLPTPDPSSLADVPVCSHLSTRVRVWGRTVVKRGPEEEVGGERPRVSSSPNSFAPSFASQVFPVLQLRFIYKCPTWAGLSSPPFRWSLPSDFLQVRFIEE